MADRDIVCCSLLLVLLMHVLPLFSGVIKYNFYEKSTFEKGSCLYSDRKL